MFINGKMTVTRTTIELLKIHLFYVKLSNCKNTIDFLPILYTITNCLTRCKTSWHTLCFS